MKNAVIYARFSSDKQTENSIEAQVRACEDYADRSTDTQSIKFILMKRCPQRMTAVLSFKR